MKKLLCLKLALLTGGLCAQTPGPVVQWNRTLLSLLRTPGAQPGTVHPSRSLAILHAAIYDAVNSIDQSHAPYKVLLTGVIPGASQDAAADAAAHEVLIALYPAFQMLLDSQYQQLLALIPDGQSKDEGVRVGIAVADQILQLRTNDGSGVVPPPFVPGSAPGDYQLTPPNLPPPVFTHWSKVTPFRADTAQPVPPRTAAGAHQSGVHGCLQ
jgi:hypothetical protein